MTGIAVADPAWLRDPERFRAKAVEPGLPLLLPGAASDWPLLQNDIDGVLQTIRRHDSGRDAEMFVGPPDIGARYHYGEALAGFNFEREPTRIGPALDRILASAGIAGADTLYIGSLPAETCLPGIETQTPIAFLPPAVRPRFWIGHASRVACHYDSMDNVACVAAGRRRFTLFPPHAIADLYVGPIDHTMAGQPVGLAVDSAPGDPRYPRFDAIRDQALVAQLGPGDAIFIPKLWWHAVEALDPVNVLVNFWWDATAAGQDPPFAAMLLAMIAIAERPDAEREAWRAWFDHYVFRREGHPLAFLPEDRHGILGPLADGNYQRIRSVAMRMLRGQ